MKQNFTKHIISLSLLLAIFTSQIGLTFAQTPDAFTSAGKSLYTLPDNAVEGSTDERRNAYNNLSAAEKSQVLQQAQDLVNNATPTQEANRSLNLSFVDKLGNSSEITTEASVQDSSDFYGKLYSKPPCYQGCVEPINNDDLDNDGLLDVFENSLADGFTPFYYVSGGENAGTGFARFNNSVPQTVSQVFGPTPPISHFRVKPLGFYNRTNGNGIRYGLIQINYHTLWNKDDGLVGSPYCFYDPIIDVTSLGNHNLDNEYSMILVAAPMVNSTYDSNIQNYKLYEVYTAAHEGTFFDQSRYYNLSNPFPFGSHIKLALSKSKHATYAFNPDYYPLFPRYVIASAYASVAASYANGSLNIYRYLALLAVLDSNFFGCIIDRFQNQGGVFATTKINVGELNRPINGSTFIQDTELSEQLSRLFY